MTTTASLTQALRDFACARDWAQFHSPKNLAAALSVEAAELLEHFQWLTEDQSRNLPKPEGGKFRIPDGPGLGLELIEDELEKRRR